jgi:hypothetical protein
MIFININFTNKISKKKSIRKRFFFKLEHTDDDELHLKSAMNDNMLLTRSTTINKSVDLQRLTASVETMRTSILQA